MRDSLNYTMLPPTIVQDNCISYNSTNGTIATLPSNGYYGYQPPINSDNKAANNHDGQQQQQQQMDVVMQFEEYDNRRRFEAVNNRKRCWGISGDIRQFKKRRQNHAIHENVDDNARKKLNKDADLFEELLKETHGCSVYHWIASNS